MLFVVLLCFRVATSSAGAATTLAVLHLGSIFMKELFISVSNLSKENGDYKIPNFFAV